MTGKNYIICCIFLSFIFLQTTIHVSAQTNPVEENSSGVQPFTNLTLEISLPEQAVFSLQPIPIVIKQSNRTTQPAKGYGKILFGFTPIRLYVKKSDSNERIAITNQSAVANLAFFENIALAPGTSSETKGLITIGLQKYFPEPGIYEIQAALPNDDATQIIESNKVNIEIKMPTGANRTVYNLIKNSSQQDFFFSGMRFDKVKDILETISVMHPNTPYGKNSAFLLGESYFALRQYPQALTNLIRLENDRDFIHADKVKDYLRQIRASTLTQTTKDEEQ